MQVTIGGISVEVSSDGKDDLTVFAIRPLDPDEFDRLGQILESVVEDANTPTFIEGWDPEIRNPPMEPFI